MFEIVRELWPVAVVLWLLDGLHLLRAGHRLFLVSPFFGRHRLLPGWRLAALLPGERAFHAQEPAVSPTADGLHIDLEPPRAGEPAIPALHSRFFRYEELNSPEIEAAKIRWDDRATTRLTSPAAALRLFKSISRLAHAAPLKRRELLAQRIRDRFDRAEIEQALATVEPWARRLDGLAVAFALVLLVGLPLSAYGRLGGPSLMPALLLALAFLYAAIVTVTLLAARKLQRWSDRSPLKTAAPILLCAPAAIRAPAALTLELLSRFDPFALAAVLLPPERFASIARAELWALEHSPSADLHTDWQNIAGERHAAVLGVLRERGLSRDVLLAPPPRPSNEATAYCPICEGSFRAGIERCEDCQRPLVAYAAPA